LIYTVTLNPAVDLMITTDQVHLGKLNRASNENYIVGGKGINISVLLNELNHQTTATGFIGGFSGEYIRQQLEDIGIIQKFISIDGISRINVKLKADEETEINGSGPEIKEKEFHRLINLLNNNLSEDDIIFLSGNNANGLTDDSYEKIAKISYENNSKLIVDTNKNLLTDCLKYTPFLIKPNRHELEEIFKCQMHNDDDIIHYAKKLQEKGALNVLVSKGEEGAVLLTENGKSYTSNVPEGKVINSVGSGDSMVAGFVFKYLETNDYLESLRFSAASGSATAFSIGVAPKETINKLVDEIQITEIQ